MKRKWAPLIEGYLRNRKPLVAALLLVDVRRELADDDRALFDWLHRDVATRGVRVELVGTKADKLPKSRQKPAIVAIAKSLGLAADAVHLTSAQSRQGLPGPPRTPAVARRERVASAERVNGSRPPTRWCSYCPRPSGLAHW